MLTVGIYFRLNSIVTCRTSPPVKQNEYYEGRSEADQNELSLFFSSSWSPSPAALSTNRHPVAYKKVIEDIVPLKMPVLRTCSAHLGPTLFQTFMSRGHP